jgi:hypothetical protein
MAGIPSKMKIDKGSIISKINFSFSIFLFSTLQGHQ